MLYSTVMREVVLILHNIRSTYNVGSIFRTADAAGVSRIYLTGYTPAPKDRFGRARKDIAKTALGAENYIPWERGEVGNVIAKLRQKDFEITAVEQDIRAISVYEYKPRRKVALIFGNEVRGVSKELCSRSDVVVSIPMQGRKESLNVSVSVGVSLFILLR